MKWPTSLKWPDWSIASGAPGDFLPVFIGCIVLFMSLPAFVLLLVMPDRNSGVIGVPLLVWLGAGIVIGLIFFVYGLRVLAFPGSLLYRITHGRIFGR
jgi:hypothetical protein